MITINYEEIPVPSKFQVGISDISNAERNAQGQMMIDRIATKRKLELEWKSLKQAEISYLLNAVKDIFFEVTYPDPMTGNTETKLFYVGDRSVPMYNYNNGDIRWEGVKMNFVER